MDILILITQLGLLLLMGIICSLIATKLKIPKILLLLVSGMFIGNIYYKGQSIVQLPELLITGIGLFALIMIVFDASSSFRIRQIEIFSGPALKLVLFFTVVNMLILTFATHLMLGFDSIFISALFAALMSGTAPSVALSLLGSSKNRIVSILELESLLNTPLIVILTFIILDFTTDVKTVAFDTFLEQIMPFLAQIITGVGAGIVVGLIVFKLMKRVYSEKISPLVLIVSAILTYALAEGLKGSGILAVTTLGLFFGNLHHIKEKKNLLAFESLFANALRILVFVLVGSVIRFPLTGGFLIKAICLFAIYVLSRFLAVYLAFNKKFEMREILFMALNCSKGLAVASVIFFLTTIAVPGLDLKPILDLSLLFILFSIITSSIAAWFSKKMLNVKVEEK